MEERQSREGRDPQQTPQDVEAVGGEGREGGKGARHSLGDQRHGCRHEHEDDRQADPHRQGGPPEEPYHTAAVTHLDGEEDDEDQEDREDDGRLPEVIPSRPSAQEADADAEKARQQHEVGEVGEIEDVGRAPADQHELEEEHQEAEEQQPELTAAIVRRRCLLRHREAGGCRSRRLQSWTSARRLWAQSFVSERRPEGSTPRRPGSRAGRAASSAGCGARARAR